MVTVEKWPLFVGDPQLRFDLFSTFSVIFHFRQLQLFGRKIQVVSVPRLPHGPVLYPHHPHCRHLMVFVLYKKARLF